MRSSLGSLSIRNLYDLPPDAAPLSVLSNEQAGIPELGRIWRAVSVLRRADDAGIDGAVANQMNVGLRDAAAAGGVARHRIEECSAVHFLAGTANHGERLSEN